MSTNPLHRKRLPRSHRSEAGNPGSLPPEKSRPTPPTPPAEAQDTTRSIPSLGTKIQIPDSREAALELRGYLDEEYERLSGVIREYEEGNRIEFFKPIEPYQTKVLELLWGGKKTVTLQGANQIGKTTLGAVFVGSVCLGIRPWDGVETPLGRRPVRVRIICKDWEHHAGEVIVPELKRWLPRGRYETKKNNVGVEAFWSFENGSTIELMTHIQDTGIHEGWKGDLVWADEPLPRDKYVANKRGLIAQDGVFLLTMTAVSESWILDDIILNTDPTFASVTEVPIWSNPYLSKAGIDSFAASLRENEKVARLMGGWLNLVGLVWKGFKPGIHIINDFEIPVDWPVVPMVDWHTSLPIAIGFYAFDPRGMIYVADEVWENGSAEYIGNLIIRRKKTNSWRIQQAFIDPLSKGDTAYVKNMGVDVKDSFTRLSDVLWAEGIELRVASKDKDSGIRNVEDRLVGLNGLPTLFFFKNALGKIGKDGHVGQIQRWTYDEKTGKPKDENDHFMENLYRVTLTGVKYTAPYRTSDKNFISDTDFSVFKPNYGRDLDATV